MIRLVVFLLATTLHTSFLANSIRGAQLPPTRRHSTTQSRRLQLEPARNSPTVANEIRIEVEGEYRIIQANGVPEHKTGDFPNRGNPHRISPQDYSYRIPANPKPANHPIPLGMHNFGIAVNGVPFDPGAAEWFLGRREGEWQYEALSGAVPLGLDENFAHVQPTGAYHYHGLPTGLLKELKLTQQQHSPLIGWAADGFPIYALYGYAKADDDASEIQTLKSSYRIKQGRRPVGVGRPGGQYDGTFLIDYEYVEDLGDLDECNGRFCVTPEFPEGTYAYFLTKHWPIIPRLYRGTPSGDFKQRRPPRRGPQRIR